MVAGPGSEQGTGPVSQGHAALFVLHRSESLDERDDEVCSALGIPEASPVVLGDMGPLPSREEGVWAGPSAKEGCLGAGQGTRHERH